MVQNEMKWILERSADHFYLEPWQRIPVDPTIEHVVTMELEDDQTITRRRVTCSCGLDRGWQFPLGASQDASWHCAHVERTKRERDLDDLPVALIEQRRVPVAFRWCCETCSARGAWLDNRSIAEVGSMLHSDACPRRRRAGTE
jgi:hypothetical protein